MISQVTESAKIFNYRFAFPCLTLYDPGGGGGGGFKSPPPPPIFCTHAFNLRAALLCVGDFSQKIV